MRAKFFLVSALLFVSACSPSRGSNVIRIPPSEANRITVSGQIVARAEGASLKPVEVLVIDPPRRYEIADKAASRELLGLIGSQARVSGIINKAESDGNSIVLNNVKLESLEPRPARGRPLGEGVEVNI